jgi:hypothetical protein
MAGSEGLIRHYGHTSSRLPGVIPEIDISRVANLMLKRYGDSAEVESARNRRRVHG